LQCLAGPEVAYPLEHCDFFDADTDNDVDAADFAQLQRTF
jgi:hypothetical protein